MDFTQPLGQMDFSETLVEIPLESSRDFTIENPFGPVEVNIHADDTVTVTADIMGRGFELETEHHGKKLSLKLTQPNPPQQPDPETEGLPSLEGIFGNIGGPADLSDLTAGNNTVTMTVNIPKGMVRDLKAKSTGHASRIIIRDWYGGEHEARDLKLECDAFAVEILGLNFRKAKVYSLTADTVLRKTSGDVKIFSAIGGLTIRDHSGEIQLRASSSDIEIEDHDGELTRLDNPPEDEVTSACRWQVQGLQDGTF